MTRRDPETLTLDEARQVLAISVPAAAKLAGVSTNAMYKACETGEVESIRFCGRVLVKTIPFTRLFGLEVDDKRVAEAVVSLSSDHAQKCGSCRKATS